MDIPPLAWAGAAPKPPQTLYWRTTKGEEVDVVIDSQDNLLLVEVKSASKVAF